jgi:hypothetical protein
MSEKTITFRYHDEVKKVNIANYEECKNAFQREFSISDEEMKKLSLFYYDEDADATMLYNVEDYNIFLGTDCNEIEAKDNSGEEKPDPLRSATIFKKQNEEPINDPLSKNDSIVLDNNSISLENSSNIAQIFTNSDKKNIPENFEVAKNLNDAGKILELMREEQENKSMIEELKKQMEEMK